MKKLLVIAIMAVIGFSVNAQSQKGDMAAGVNLSLGTGSGFTNFGIGAEFQWNITDAIRLEPSVNYFLESDFVSMWDVNVDAQYVFDVANKLEVYPFVGLTVLGAKADVWGYSASSTNFGANIGGGAQYWFTDKIAASLEVKYQLVSDFDRVVLSLGAAYKF